MSVSNSLNKTPEQDAKAFVARHPIYDMNLNVEAYELLYRNNNDNEAHILNDDVATAQVITNSFTEFSFNELVSNKLAFVNFSQHFLNSEILDILPVEKIVLEILEHVPVDAELLQTVEDLSNKGFTIALDDYIGDPKYDSLLPLVDVVKFDVMEIEKKDIPALVEKLQQYNVKLLAEKVETREEFELCKRLGFQLYQGYYFCKPHLVSSGKLPANRNATLQLLARLFDPGVGFVELEKLVTRDASLSYKMLRIMNSAAYSMTKNIDSIRQALSLIGINNVRNWVSLIAFSGIENKSNELFRTAMLRAKQCELLAKATNQVNADVYFTVGLLSNIDCFMDQTMDTIIQPLPLTDEVKDALVLQSGIKGEALKCVCCYENANWTEVAFQNLDSSQIVDIYFEAIRWVNEIELQLSQFE